MKNNNKKLGYLEEGINECITSFKINKKLKKFLLSNIKNDNKDYIFLELDDKKNKEIVKVFNVDNCLVFLRAREDTKAYYFNAGTLINNVDI